MFEYIKSFFVSKPVSPELVNEVKKTIADNKVVVYSKSYCPYCTLTKNLLKDLNQPFYLKELNLESEGSDVQKALLELTGQKTVPNIFINGEHIGGNSDIQALKANGKLTALLK